MAFWTIVQVGLLLVSVGWGAYRYYSARNEKASVAGFDSASLPRANEGDAVPIVYGQVRIRAPQLVVFQEATGSPRSIPDVGVEYGIDARFILCLSNDRPIPGGVIRAGFVKMFVGDKEIGGIEPRTPPLTGDGLTGYSVLDENVLGGDVLGAGGRIYGRMSFYDGSWNQQLRQADGTYTAETDPGATLENTPGYRGFVCVKLEDWFYGLSPQMPPYSVVVHNPTWISGHALTTGPLANNQANPAAVLYDILTNEWGRLGISTDLVDTDSFVTCAATLQDEQHGCSVLVTSANRARDVVEQLLKQIDATLYEDPTTRRLTLELVREDYDPNTLPEFDPSNVVGDPKMATTLSGELPNEVRVLFTNPVSGFVEGVAVEQELAAINASGGRRKTVELRFPWCSHLQTAQELAARELNFLSRPIAMLTIKVNREGFDLRPGSVFRFTWPEWSGYTNVFRVTEIDYGTLTEGTITIQAVQDRFAIQGTTFDPPDDEIGPTTPVADPIQLRVITEAPRWIMLKAYEQGHIANVDAQRGYFLAAPEGSDSRYQVQTGWSSALQEVDMPGRVFPGTFTVETTYARTTSAYDTATGLRIENVTGWTPGSATTTEIQVDGRNVISVVDADGNLELMAYESATDEGGGVWTLENVWRGILDTVPATHAVGAQGYVLPGSFLAGGMGRRVYTHGDAITAYTQGAAGSSVVPVEDSPEDTFTARSRTLLPYPGANLLLAGSKTPAAIEEGGVTIQWSARDRLKALITRSDTAAETVESLTTFDAVAVKGDPVTPGNETLLAQEHASSSTVQVPLGAAGHGTLAVGARTRRTGVALSNGTTPIGGVFNWQTPLLDVEAYHWRNLLLNPRFASGVGLTYWDTVQGVPTTSNSGGLGNNSFYVTGQSGTTVEIQQLVPIAGYLPANYNAVLDFYVHNGGDTGDTVQVELLSLDSGGNTLQTQTYGASDPGNGWVKQTLTISDLHDDTANLRVRIVLAAVGELDSVASCRVTELCLRVGQVSAQLLSNPSFEAGLTDWTAGGSGMQVLTTTKYELTNYVRPQDGASSTLAQTVSLPDGYEDSEAVLECARMNDAADDTGTVLLEALDGSSNVLDSVTTGAEAISPTNAWVRRRLVMTVPAATASLRVTFTGTRVTGTPNNSCVDDFDLRCHKHLDPDEETQLFEDLAFVEQPLPRSVTDWKQHFPTVPAPDYAIYDGGLVGRLGIEPLLEAGAGCVANGKAVVLGPEGDTTTCYESSGTSTTADEDIHTAPVGDAFANFGTNDPFTALAFVKADGPIAAVCGVMGRVVGSRGWEMRLNSSGTPRVVLYGASATETVGGGEECDDGALHGFALIHDNAAEELHVVDATGDYSTSTAGMGEIRATTPGKFRILATGVSGQNRFAGQVPRAYLWRQALTPAQVTEVLRYAESPVASLTSSTRTGTVACVVGSDSEGVLVERFGPDRAALALDSGSGRVGLVGMPAIDNLMNEPFTAEEFGTLWENAGATLTLGAAVGPDGHRNAIKIEGSVSVGLLCGFTFPMEFGSTGTRYLHFFARADDSHTMQVNLSNAFEDPIDDETFNVNPQWQLFTWAMAWDDSAGPSNGYLTFRASDDGTERTIYLCPVMFVGGTAARPWPGTIPIGAPGATAPLLTIAPSAQFNREGEIEVELVNYDEVGVIANAHNNVDDDDRRRITWPATGGDDIGSEHYDGAGVDDSSALVANTTIDIASPWKARLRWNRAGLVDGVASAFVVLRAEQGATVEQDGGRAATFSASTAPLTRLALLHEDGATNAMAGLVFSARISARERKV